MIFMSAVTKKQIYIGVDMTAWQTGCLFVGSLSLMPNSRKSTPNNLAAHLRVRKNNYY